GARRLLCPRRMHRPSHRIALLLLAGSLQACATGDTDDPGAGQPAGDPSAPLRFDVAPRQAAYLADEPVLVDVTITNTSAGDARLLAWMLPDADLEEPLFEVTQGGQRAAFVGPHYKRAHTEAADFVPLAAGASITRQVDLARFYDLSRTGDLEIQLVVGARELVPDGASAGAIRSNTARTWVEGHAQPAAELAPVTIAGPLSFSRCSTTQMDTVTQAVAAANSMSD